MSDKKIIIKLEKEFDYLESKVSEIRAAAEAIGGETLEKFNKELDRIKGQIEVIKKDFDAAKASAPGNWEELKISLQERIDQIKDSFKDFKDRLEQ